MYFLTVLRSYPTCWAMAKTLRPCWFKSLIKTISLIPCTRLPLLLSNRTIKLASRDHANFWVFKFQKLSWPLMVGNFHIPVLGSLRLALRHCHGCAISRRSAQWFHGVMPRPKQVHHSPEWSPVSLGPLSPGYGADKNWRHPSSYLSVPILPWKAPNDADLCDYPPTNNQAFKS